MKPITLGWDLGGTQVKHILMDQGGRVLGQGIDPFQSIDSELSWKATIQGVATKIAHQLGDLPENMGLAAPGLVSQDGCSIAHMPGRLQGLEGLQWQEVLGHRRPIPVINDAHAALLGESRHGAARGMEQVIMITLGTGVGGAVMVDGHLLKGYLGRAGHLGHLSLDVDGPPDICRTPGSLEWAIGNATIVERSQGRFHSTLALIQAFEAGDTLARQIWLRSIHCLAAGITSMINLLDPEAIILGGGIAAAGSSLFQPLQEKLNTMEWQVGSHRVRILPAQLGEYAGAMGAACMTMESSSG